MTKENDEFQLRRELNRAGTAKDLLDNEIFREAIERIEIDIITMWKNCSIEDTKTQEKLKMMLFVAQKFVTHLTSILQTGQLAEFSLKELEEKKKRSFF
jgi:signal transduction protein with GAF and PtsI domain